jgi:hypothetical protein
MNYATHQAAQAELAWLPSNEIDSGRHSAICVLSMTVSLKGEIA